MLFIEKIKQLREQQQLPQRQLAAALDIDTATYCKIEKGDRKVKRDQVSILAERLKYNKEELLDLWLADKVYDIVKEENTNNVLSIVAEKFIEQSNGKKNKKREADKL